MESARTIARERVTRGAAQLDELRPGWDTLVNVDLIDLSTAEDCVLGQVFGNYCTAIDTYIRRDDLDERIACGFTINGDRIFEAFNDLADYEGGRPALRVLEEAWREEILRRRAHADA
jgi:hypothetical protein